MTHPSTVVPSKVPAIFFEQGVEWCVEECYVGTSKDRNFLLKCEHMKKHNFIAMRQGPAFLIVLFKSNGSQDNCDQ